MKTNERKERQRWQRRRSRERHTAEKQRARERTKERQVTQEKEQRRERTHREVEVDDLSSLLSLHRMATNELRCNDRSHSSCPALDYLRCFYLVAANIRFTGYFLRSDPFTDRLQDIMWSYMVITFILAIVIFVDRVPVRRPALDTIPRGSSAGILRNTVQ